MWLAVLEPVLLRGLSVIRLLSSAVAPCQKLNCRPTSCTRLLSICCHCRRETLPNELSFVVEWHRDIASLRPWLSLPSRYLEILIVCRLSPGSSSTYVFSATE